MRKYQTDLILPFPPSVNSCYRSIPRGKICTSILSKIGREYKQRVIGLIDVNQCKEDARLMVQIMLYMPDRRRRDIDNYSKALLDSLTGIIWHDDEQIDLLAISREGIFKGGKVEMSVREL